MHLLDSRKSVLVEVRVVGWVVGWLGGEPGKERIGLVLGFAFKASKCKQKFFRRCVGNVFTREGKQSKIQSEKRSSKAIFCIENHRQSGHLNYLRQSQL